MRFMARNLRLRGRLFKPDGEDEPIRPAQEPGSSASSQFPIDRVDPETMKRCAGMAQVQGSTPPAAAGGGASSKKPRFLLEARWAGQEGRIQRFKLVNDSP